MIISRAVPPTEGRIAIVTNVGAGCGGRVGAADERRAMRTAKSCGPDPPTLGSSLAVMIRKATVAKKPGTPGRARISRKTIAQGMPDDPAKPVVTAACVFCCRRAMGEAITRHSLRPLIPEGVGFQDPDRSCRGNVESYPQKCGGRSDVLRGIQHAKARFIL